MFHTRPDQKLASVVNDPVQTNATRVTRVIPKLVAR